MERDMWSQWRTDCPSCGHDVLVVDSVTLSSGKRHYPRSRLYSEGFEVFPMGCGVDCDDEPEDQSTEDEVVKCEGCGKRFDLAELELG